MHHVFVFNPHAGKSGNGEALKEKALSRFGKDTVFHVTIGPGDATTFVRSFCESHPGEPVRFYACGGDGTLNEVIHGMQAFDGASVYPYPCGSGNDFVKYYGKAEEFLSLPEDIADVPADLMQVGDRYAVNVVNFGFDTKVCRVMEKLRHVPLLGGKTAYYLGVVNALFTAMKNPCTVTVDGDVLHSGAMLLCTLANGQYVGGSFRCAPRSDNTDGLMEVCLVKPISRFTLVKLIGVYVKGTHLDDPRFASILRYKRGRTVEVTAPDGFAFCLDGEIIPSSRFTVNAVPGGLRVAVPASLVKPPATV